MNANILLIDDEADTFKPIMRVWAEWAKLSVTWFFAENDKVGHAILATNKIDLVLMDGNLIGPGGRPYYGEEVVKTIRTGGNQVPICMFSSNEKRNKLGIQAGADFSVNKEKFLDGYGQRHEEEIGQEAFAAMDNLAAIITLVLLKKAP